MPPPAASAVWSGLKPYLLSLRAPLGQSGERLFQHWASQGCRQVGFSPPALCWSRAGIPLGRVRRSRERRRRRNGRTVLLTFAWGEALRMALTSLCSSQLIVFLCGERGSPRLPLLPTGPAVLWVVGLILSRCSMVI